MRAQPTLTQDASMHISWAPSQKCDDSPGGNCALCNEFALQCLVCLGGYGFNSRGQCQKVRGWPGWAGGFGVFVACLGRRPGGGHQPQPHTGAVVRLQSGAGSPPAPPGRPSSLCSLASCSRGGCRHAPTLPDRRATPARRLQCTDAGIQLCLTCDLKTKPAKCLKCLGVPTHDVPLSWSNPGFPVYQAPNGRCKRVRAARPLARLVTPARPRLSQLGPAATPASGTPNQRRRRR